MRTDVGNYGDERGTFAEIRIIVVDALPNARSAGSEGKLRAQSPVSTEKQWSACLVYRSHPIVVVAPRAPSRKYGDVVSWSNTRHQRKKLRATFQEKITEAPSQLRAGLHIENGETYSRKKSARYVTNYIVFTLSLLDSSITTYFIIILARHETGWSTFLCFFTITFFLFDLPLSLIWC